MIRAVNLIIVTFLIVSNLLIDCQKKNEDVGGEAPEIVLLVDSFDGYFNQDATATYYWKHYMIINADEDDVESLRELVEQFIINNRSAIEEEASGYTAGKEVVIYNVWFYRESEYLPRDWVPDGSYFSEDTIDNHKGDLIVLVEWEQNSNVLKYSISIRSKANKTYGAPIYRYKYINDLLVEIQTYPEVGDYAAEYIYPDFDGDGLSNLEEIELGTDLYSTK